MPLSQLDDDITVPSISMRFVWVASVIVPLMYLLLLPALSTLDPFGTGTFASAVDGISNVSISAYLNTAPANAGFALFTAPSVVYLCTNPVTRRSCIANVGCGFFTFGYILLVLFPLGFASPFLHHLGFVLSIFGFFITALGMLLNINYSLLLFTIYIFVVLCNLFMLSTIFLPSVIFVILEYVNAIFVLAYAPLVNTVGTVGWWIRFVNGGVRFRIVSPATPAAQNSDRK